MFSAQRNHDASSFAQILRDKRRQSRRTSHQTNKPACSPTLGAIPVDDPPSRSVSPLEPGRLQTLSTPNVQAGDARQSRQDTPHGGLKAGPARSKRNTGDTNRRRQSASANTSAKRSRDIAGMRDTSAKKATLETEMLRGRPRMDRCCLCDGDLANAVRHQCSQCPDIQYCQVCAGNISVLHEGHSFELRQPDGSGFADDISQPDHETRQPPHCYICKEVLYDLRYQCQDCPSTNLCSSCRKFHPDHTLKAITCPYDPETDVDGHVEGEAAGLEFRAEEASVTSADTDNEARPGAADHADLEATASDSVIEINTDAEQAVALPTPGKATQHAYVQVPYKDYLRMTKAEQALKTMVGIAKEFAGGRTAKDRMAMGKLQAPGRRLPVDLATLDAEDSAALNNGEAELQGASEDDAGSDEPGSNRATPLSSRRLGTRQGSGHKRRPWTHKDRRRLRDMKEEGWDDERIGLALGRSSGAVLQQWRKQK